VEEGGVVSHSEFPGSGRRLDRKWLRIVPEVAEDRFDYGFFSGSFCI
jgi:hypothetical protein